MTEELVLEKKEKIKYEYDAVIVLGANVKKIRSGKASRFVASDFYSPTEMGLAGGGIRIGAAAELYAQKKTGRFIFSGGISPRTQRLYPEDNIISEAEIYSQQFLNLLNGLRKRSDFSDKFKDLENPEVILEKNSNNTQKNIQEVLQLIFDLKLKRVAVLTSEYHKPRVEAFYRLALKDHPEIETDVSFLSAEKIMQDAYPGKYDNIIRKAYESPDGLKRLKNEEQGLKDIQAGKYKPDPFKIKSK